MMNRKIVFYGFCLMLGLSACSKHYQGDLEQFSLEGNWQIREGGSAEKGAGKGTDGRWREIRLPAGGLKEVQRPLLLRKQFVLMGHFVEKVLYLSLGRVPRSVEVLLNGSLLKGESPFFPVKNKITAPDFVFEIDPAILHFGRENSLTVRIDTVSGRDSLLSDHPGIYTRLSFLNLAGYRVEACPYKLEREIHSRLEDLSQDWRAMNGRKLQEYFSAEPGASETVQADSLLLLAEQKQPAEIVLRQPGFYRQVGGSAVMVLGDWVFQYNDQPPQRFPFHWKLVSRNKSWYVEEIF